MRGVLMFCTGVYESLSAQGPSRQVEGRGGRGGQTVMTARVLNHYFPVRQGRPPHVDNGSERLYPALDEGEGVFLGHQALGGSLSSHPLWKAAC